MDDAASRRSEGRAAGIAVGLLVVLVGTWVGDVQLPAGPSTRVGGAAEVLVFVHGDRGEPLAGATVSAESDARRVEARTGANGGAALPPIRPGRYRFRVEAPAHRTLATEIPLERRGLHRLAVHLEAGGDLRVRVVDGTTHEPVSASLIVQGAAGRGVARGATDDDGVAIFRGLPARELLVEASARGHATEGVAVTIGAGAVAEAEIALTRIATIAGVVTSPDGTAARGAIVQVAGSGVWPPREARTDDEGRFRFGDLPGGIYDVVASRGHLAALPRRGLVLEPGDDRFLRLGLSAGESIRGRVRARGGSVITGAEIAVAEQSLALHQWAAESGRDGTFAIHGLPSGAYVLRARAEGYVAASTDVVAGGPEVVLVLEPAARIEGIVYDTFDRPVAGASVDVLGEAAARAVGPVALGRAAFAHRLDLAESGSLGVTEGPVPPLPVLEAGGEAAGPEVVGVTGVVTDAEGRFVVDGLPAGVVQLLVEHTGHAATLTAPIRLRGGATREGLEIVMREGGAVEGRVVDAGGFPASPVPVELRAEHERLPRIAVTEADGLFVFDAVAGIVIVTAQPMGQPAVRERVVIEPGATRQVTLTLESQLVTLEGRVLATNGDPLVGATAELSSLRATRPYERTYVTGDDGRFEATSLPPPPYRIRFQAEARVPRTLDVVELPSGLLEVRLAGAVPLVGRALDDRTEAAVSGASITAEARGAREEAMTLTDGTFEISSLTSGRYSVILRHNDYVERTLSVQVRDTDERTDLGDVRLAPAASVAGEVVDNLGDPVPGASVRVSPGAPATTTDEAGRFVLRGIAPGRATLRASAEGASEGHTEPLTLAPGEHREDVRIRLSGRLPTGDAGTPPAESGLRTGVAIEVATQGDAVVVTQVVSGSAAARAGLRVGDRIIAVDEQTVRIAGEARSALRGPAGVVAHVELARGGRRIHVQVERETYQP